MEEKPQPDPIVSLFSKYFDGNGYMSKFDAARKRREDLLAAYKGSIADTAQIPKSVPSQAERYFRLTQALLDPGQTGHFSEAMRNVSGVAADLAKEDRLAEQEQAQRAIQAGEQIKRLDIEAAGEEIETLGELAGEERKAQMKLLEEAMKPKSAQSAAGKQAMDEGLTPGTPDFHKRVAEIAQASGDAAEARINVALANAALAQTRFEESQREFSTYEQKILGEEEDALFSRQEAIGLLNEALSLNDLAYSSSAADVVAYNAALATKPDSPKVIATNELNNILKSQMLTVLKSTFGAAPTEGERAILQEVQGIESKSKEERRRIIARAIRLAEARIKKSERKISDIQSGKYRFRTGEAPQ